MSAETGIFCRSSKIVELGQIGMVHPRHGLRLHCEPSPKPLVTNLKRKDLERDLTFKVSLDSIIDRSHPTSCDKSQPVQLRDKVAQILW